ncbi:MAG TPA: rhomboid family intramembrane serine protease [Gemmatimonadaceae bacterium]
MEFSHSEDTNRLHITPAVRWLALAWVGVGLLQATVVMPADVVGWLGFRTSGLEHTWWTAVSYPFVQAGSWSLVVSVYALLVFGPSVEHVWGSRAFVTFFVWCAIGGALVHALFAQSAVFVGATAGVFGVMMAYAWLWPKEELYVLGILPMRVWTMITILAVAMLMFGASESAANGAGYLAHLGGFLFAALYLKRPNPVSIEDLRQRVSAAPDPTGETPRAVPRTLPRSRREDETDEVVARSNAAVAEHQMPAARTTVRRDVKREALNRVLDKISEQGLDSLTPSDRAMLEEMSRKLRDR